MRSIRIGNFFACELRHQDYAQKLASGRLPGGYVVIVRTRLGTPPQMRAVCVTPPMLDLAEEGAFRFLLASLPAAAPTEQRINSKETRR